MAFYSCISEVKKKEAKEKKDNEQYSIIKDKIKENLISKYSIKFELDTLTFPFEIDYKPVINSKYQLINQFAINNIYSKDSIEYISIRTGVDFYFYSEYFPVFYFDFPITKDQEKEIRQNVNNITLVISIEKIQTIKFALEAEIEESASAKIILKNSNNFIVKGKIIEIIKLPKK